MYRPPSCLSTLKTHVQRVNHRIALYKHADKPILEKAKPYVDGLTMECWNRCGSAILSYQTHWLIFWTLVTVKGKKSGRIKTRTNLILTISVNGVLKIIMLKPVSGYGAAPQKRSFWLAIYLDQ